MDLSTWVGCALSGNTCGWRLQRRARVVAACLQRASGTPARGSSPAPVSLQAPKRVKLFVNQPTIGFGEAADAAGVQVHGQGAGRGS